MNLFITIAVLFIIAVVSLWLFWKFDKEEDKPVKEQMEYQPSKPISETLVQEIEKSNQEFLKNLRKEKETKDIDDEPVEIPKFNDLKMFTRHQSTEPAKPEKPMDFQGFDRRKLGMTTNSEMIENSSEEGLLTKQRFSIEKNKAPPRLTLALKLNPGLLDAYKSVQEGSKIDQGKMVLDQIQKKTGVELLTEK